MNKTQLINFLIDRHKFSSYLEIGVGDGRGNFNDVICAKKTGVDPSHHSATHCCKSDDFFSVNKDLYDLIFIDGDHRCEQVDKDINNSLKVLSPRGIIICHDCLPIIEDHQRKSPVVTHWNGDVWKSIAKLRVTRDDLDVCVIDMDCGCGMITRSTNVTLYKPESDNVYTWDYYQKHKHDLLNIVNEDSIIKTKIPISSSIPKKICFDETRKNALDRLPHFISTLKQNNHTVSIKTNYEVPDADIWFVEHYAYNDAAIQKLNECKDKFLQFKGKLIFYAIDDGSWCNCKGLDEEIMNRVDAWMVFITHPIGYVCRPKKIAHKFVMIPRYTIDYKLYNYSTIKKNRIYFVGLLTGAYGFNGKNWRAECMRKISENDRLKEHFSGGIVTYNTNDEIVCDVEKQNIEYNKTFQHLLISPIHNNGYQVESNMITLCIPGNTTWSYRQSIAMSSKTAIITFNNLQADPGRWLYDDVFTDEFYYVKNDLSDFEAVCDYALTHIKETAEKAEAGYHLYRKYFELSPSNTYKLDIWNRIRLDFEKLGVNL